MICLGLFLLYTFLPCLGLFIVRIESECLDKVAVRNLQVPQGKVTESQIVICDVVLTNRVCGDLIIPIIAWITNKRTRKFATYSMALAYSRMP